MTAELPEICKVEARMKNQKSSQFTWGLRWVILAIILAATLAGCPSTSSSSVPNGGAVTNEGVLNSPGGCGPGCNP
jgi:hypothetical protein